MSSSIERAPWYVVATYPQNEYRVWRALAGGFTCYLPQLVTYRVLRRHGRPVQEGGKGQLEVVLRPLFTGYLMVRFDQDDPSWGVIGRTPGVKRIIATPEGRPLALPGGFVEQLMDRGRAGDGAIDPGIERFPRRLEPGEAVQVEGVSEGLIDALVQSSSGDRVFVLLRLFGRQTRAEVSRQAIRA